MEMALTSRGSFYLVERVLQSLMQLTLLRLLEYNFAVIEIITPTFSLAALWHE
ncbi:hypothetical protein yaldo0001_19150 [Yersinia aldovae ATCC 35236]|nr:hypothetical protein yaldo0001_19150 [Yersinia aldovae ATCC 35236]